MIRRQLQAGKPTKKVLHLSDIHIDLNYQEGTEADCGETVCCEPASPKKGANGTVKAPAPYWGVSASSRLSCDIPSRTAESAFAWIAENDKVVPYKQQASQNLL